MCPPPYGLHKRLKMAKVQEANPKEQEFADKVRTDTGRKHLKEERTFEFYNLEEPGLAVKFSYGPTTSPKRYNFWHGEKYTIPVEVAEHVERSQTPIYGYRPDGTGRMVKQLTGWKPRFQMREVRA